MYDFDEEQYDHTTIVGKRLHGPTFDGGEDDETHKVGARQYRKEVEMLIKTSLSAIPGRTRNSMGWCG